MICPLCENVQESGAECDVCGARIAPSASPPPVAAAPLPELEPTVLQFAAAVDVPSPAAEGQAWIEATAATPVMVVVDALEVERTTQDPAARERTPVSAALCRYCRTPTNPGQRFCETCGMSLPSKPAAPAPPEPTPVRCRGCGSIVTGRSCPGCGARAPAA